MVSVPVTDLMVSSQVLDVCQECAIVLVHMFFLLHYAWCSAEFREFFSCVVVLAIIRDVELDNVVL